MKEKLEFKLLVLGMVILVGGMLTAGMLIVNMERDDIFSLSGDRLIATAKVINKAIERTMLEGKADLSKSLADDLKGVSGFDLDVYNFEGRKAFDSGTEPSDDEILQSTLLSGEEIVSREGKELTAYMPLENEPSCRQCHPADRPVIGAVRVSMSLAREYENVVGFMFYMGLGGLVGILVVGTLFWQILRRNIISPIKELEASADRMAEGDLSFRTNVSSNDEIGRLDNSIKESLLSISSILSSVRDVSKRIASTSDMVERESDAILDRTLVESEAVAEISSSVEELNAAISEIADGTNSLAQSVEITAVSVEEMTNAISSITQISHDVSEGIDSTSSSIEELSANIKEVADSAGDLSSVSEETLSAVEEIIGSVKEVEATAKESAKLSEKVTEDASSVGVTAINKTMEGMERIRVSVSRTAEAIEKLGLRSEEIGSILTVIDDVADQTTLLALNAAILAAQAGEHGKGFSVVANEIKDLAERTAFSTQEIDNLIKAVRQEVSETVRTMDEGKKAVEEGIRLSKEASSALRMILESSRKASEMSASIDRTTSEQARTARYVSEAIERVRGLVEQIARATSEQSKGVNFIIRASERMRDASHKADAAIEQQAAGSRQISHSLDSINEKSRQISMAIQEQKTGAKQIWTSVEKIKEIPDENRDLAFKINRAVRELTRDSELVNMEMERFVLYEGRRSEVIRLGVVPYKTPSELFRRFSALIEYLQKETGKRFELLIAPDFKTAISDLGRGKTQLCFMGPLTYVEASRSAGAVPLVRSLRNGKPYHRGVVVTKADNRITSLGELNNRSFAFVDKFSGAGYLVPLMLLRKAGVELADLSYYHFLGQHEDVIRGVLKGDFDAGGVMESIAEKYKDHGLRVLAYSGDIPEFNISAGSTLPETDRASVRSALLKLSSGKPETSVVVGAIDKGLTGFEAVSDNDFDSMREMLSKAEA